MASDPEGNFPADYRTARKTFIAACEKTRADPISRVHPKLSGPDGKPLFIDSVALGPREAKKAILVVTNGARASAAISALLLDGVALPENTRLVLVHAFDPFSFAGASANDPQWALAMLRAVATEDLAQVTDLTVLALETEGLGLVEVLKSQKPRIRLALKQIGAKTGMPVLRDVVAEAFSRF